MLNETGQSAPITVRDLTSAIGLMHFEKTWWAVAKRAKLIETAADRFHLAQADRELSLCLEHAGSAVERGLLDSNCLMKILKVAGGKTSPLCLLNESRT